MAGETNRGRAGMAHAPSTSQFASEASVSASIEHMLNDTALLYEDPEFSLGSIALALDKLHRNDLLHIADKFVYVSGKTPRKDLSSYNTEKLRDFLRDCARKIYRIDPRKIVELNKYLSDYCQSRVKSIVS